MFKRLREKAKASAKSATMGLVVAGFIPAAVWVQTHPEIVSQVVGQGWGGIIVAVAGLAVAIARARSL